MRLPDLAPADGSGPATRFERRSLWQATMTAPNVPVGPVSARADVAIVGGGYTGLTAALFLARAGARVVLLEAQRLGWGASTRNGGMFHAGLKVGRASLVRRYGRELGEIVHREGHEAFAIVERLIADEAIDCDYRRTGQVVLAWSRRHAARLEAAAAEAVDDGLPVAVAQASALRDEIGTDAYNVGLVEEMAGGLHPGKFLAGLAERAIAAGVEIHETTPATRIERAPYGVRVVTPGGPVEARDVVIATNGYAGRLVPWVQRRVLPIGSYIVATERLDAAVAAEISPKGRMFFDTKNFLYYWRLTPDGRMLFGGRASFAPTSVDRTARILSAAMRRVHPQLAGTTIDYAWGGKVAFTFDRLPHLGRRDGVTYALGYCGSGVCMATYFGTVVARMLAEGSEARREPSGFERIPFPGAPLVPALYRGDPWFLPIVGEAFRLQDRLSRIG